MLARPCTSATVAAGPDSAGHTPPPQQPSPVQGHALIPRVWSMAPARRPAPPSASSPGGSSRPGSQESTRFVNISRTGSPRGAHSPFASTPQAHAGSRPVTTHSSHAPRRVSVSGPAPARQPRRPPGSRSGVRTAGGRATPGKTPEPFKYLRRRTVSPATMRYHQVKDDLALLLQKHKRDVEKEQARDERHLRAEQDSLAFEAEVQERAAWQLTERQAVSPNAVGAHGEAGQDADAASQDAAAASRPAGGEVEPPERAERIAPTVENGQAKQEAVRPMADLSARMRASFRTSIEKVAKRKDPLEQRLVNKQAVGVEKSAILSTLAALRGQRHRLVQHVNRAEQERREKNEQEARLQPVPSFSVGTRWGEVKGGDTRLEFDTGDVDTWLKQSLLKKEQVLSGLSDFSLTLAEHMPVLADVERQREELEEERQALAANLQDLRKIQQSLYETATFQAQSEKIKGERDALRHSWSGTTGVHAHTGYDGGDSWHERARGVGTPPNYPFKPHYPERPRAPVHEGATKEMARQALLRLELSNLLRADSALCGLVPPMPHSVSRRVAPHMYNVMSCVPTEEKERIAQSSWESAHSFLRQKSRLDPHTGKLTDASMKLAHTSIASNSHSSTINSQMWIQAQMRRSWDPTSTPGPTRHPMSCCCLSCSLDKQGEHPKTRLLYRRLSTHEAGNALTFAETGKAVATWPHAQESAAKTSPLGARPRHPQVPHGFKSPPRPPAARSPGRGNSKEENQGQLKELALSEAVRGGHCQSLLFAARVDGLTEPPPRAA